MKVRRAVAVFAVAWLGLIAWAACRGRGPSTTREPALQATMPSATRRAPAPDTVGGWVLDADGPVGAATVRVQATTKHTQSAADGSFSLSGLAAGVPVTVTAWAHGYYVGWTTAAPGAEPVSITLKPYYTSDNPDYDWFSLEGEEGSKTCGHCMPAYPEWLEDAHAQSAANPRFLTMYNGTDVQGNQSPLTRYGHSRDYGSFPLRPDPSEPYYGPGYKLDFADTAGNCATCHVPAMAARPGQEYAADPNQASGIELEGVFCEFCHKIGDVILDPDTQLPYPNRPGVLSMRLYRPPEGEQLFFGQFDDVTRRVSRLPLIEESAYCAPCHYGVFWDTVVYNSYGEWLESPYSGPESGQTCQDCHMPPAGYDYFVYPEQGGLRRDPERILSHRMPGAMDEELLRNAVTLTATARLEGDAIEVRVEVTNDRTGHHVPTDSPLRNVLLVVSATDSQGNALALLDGPVLPGWAGDYAGRPGRGYAKVLEELWTGVWPSGAYWNHTRIREDTRLAALATDTSAYRFAAPAEGEAVVEAKLVFRRAFQQLMEWKGWDVPDIVMEESRVVVGPPGSR